MRYVKGFSHYNEKARTAMTLGKFDGLHRGHRKLVERIMEHVEHEPELKSVVCFFEMTEFKKQNHMDLRKLMTNEERAIRLEGRVDYLVECPFLSVKEMEAEDFIEKILASLFHVKYIVVGENFRFGYKRRGDIKMLEKYSTQYDYRLEVIPNQMYGDRVVSSTYVKEIMKTPDIGLANKLLSYPYTIAGEVKKGSGYGRKIGTPTMDILPCQEKILPPDGVYICKLCVDGLWYQGVCNIGFRPTVTTEEKKILSVHLFCYNEKEEACGKEVVVQLYQYIRAEIKFPNVELLKGQIQEDIRIAKRHFIQTGSHGKILLGMHKVAGVIEEDEEKN